MLLKMAPKDFYKITHVNSTTYVVRTFQKLGSVLDKKKIGKFLTFIGP
jgi:hypothetical protein